MNYNSQLFELKDPKAIITLTPNYVLQLRLPKS